MTQHDGRMDTSRTPRRALALCLSVATATVLSACGSAETSSGGASSGTASASSSSAPATTTPAATGTGQSTAAGRYIDWATYQSEGPAAAEGKVVLFFHADWCPICVDVEKSLESAPVPEGLTVVKIDYDKQTDLRRTYGVTIQHTFVQVDAEGNRLAKWSEGTRADEILAKTV